MIKINPSRFLSIKDTVLIYAMDNYDDVWIKPLFMLEPVPVKVIDGVLDLDGTVLLTLKAEAGVLKMTSENPSLFRNIYEFWKAAHDSAVYFKGMIDMLLDPDHKEDRVVLNIKFNKDRMETFRKAAIEFLESEKT